MELAIGGVAMSAGEVKARRRVVRAVESGVVAKSVDDRMPGLIHVLERWAIWCESFKVHIGYRKHVSGMLTGGSDVVRNEDQAAQQDARNCELVDTAIDDLPPAQRAAINKRYGLMAASVFRFPRDNYVELLDSAHATLMKTISKKGVDF